MFIKTITNMKRIACGINALHNMPSKLNTVTTLLLFFILSFFTLASSAQTVITGRVTDQNSLPVTGASVYVQAGSGVITDNNGNYRLATTLSGQRHLTVSYIGYKTVGRTINLNGTSISEDFILESEATGMNAVVITANTSRRVQQVIPISVTILSAARLENLKFNSQADILRTIPGITAEGGGGEVANNIFVRGLPSGGQFVFSPLQIDGMPVISTMGLNSSAPDVYFRNDLGISSLEFVRGGASTLYGVGSVAGIINYTSKVGTDVQKTILESEYASPGKLKFDFNTGGPLNEKNVYYNLTGTYRYDEGPIVSGIPTTGYQFRGNVRKVMENGSFTLYAQYINDKVQFYVPYPLTSDRKIPTGYDGKDINTLETADVTNLTVRTPNGFYQSHASNGVSTKGGYIMAAFQHNFGNNWKFDAKLRIANYQHEFNFFNPDGNGKNPLTQQAYLTKILKGVAAGASYTYADDGTTVNPNALVLENTIIDRNRPLNEISSQVNISKSFMTGMAKHNVNLGTFVSRTEATDYNVQIRYLSEFKDQPRLINVSYTDSFGVAKNATKNGVLAVPGYANKLLASNKTALFISDEVAAGKFNIDFGARVEHQSGRINAEKSATANNTDGIPVAWGTGSFNRFSLHATDWAIAAGISYRVLQPLNVYANFSRGYFFPNYNGFAVSVVGGIPAYPDERPEHIIQEEAGAKFGGKNLTATVALFHVILKDRFNVSYLNVGGVLQESVAIISSKSTGVEATWDWTLVKNLHAEGAFTYQTHEYTKYSATPTNVGNWLERQPRFNVNGGLTYNDHKLDAGFNINYTGMRYGNPSNLVKLDPYSISRLDAGYTVNMHDNSTIRIGAGIFNLFNVHGITEGNPRAGDAQTNSGDFFVGRPILPISFFARLTLTF